MFGFPSLVYPHIGEISRFFPLRSIEAMFSTKFLFRENIALNRDS